MTLEKHYFLLEKAARRLAGRPVTVRIRQPYLKGYQGMAYNDRQKGAVIDLAPELGEAAALRLFLHECAHIRQDWAEMAPSSYADYPSSSVVPTRSFVAGHQVDPAEAGADVQAAAWLKFADQNTKTDDIPGRLQALAKWIDPELQDLLDNAVKDAVKRFTNQQKG